VSSSSHTWTDKLFQLFHESVGPQNYFGGRDHVLTPDAPTFPIPTGNPRIFESCNVVADILNLLRRQRDAKLVWWKRTHAFLMRKASGFNFSAFISSRIQRDLEPLPVQVSLRFFLLEYEGEIVWGAEWHEPSAGT
jgi:hypothetical protein